MRQLKADGFRPDLVEIDTWFRVTAGAGVGEQTDMSVALKNVREFQDRLNEWKVEDGLPEVTIVINAHTTYTGLKLFGSITQFADCDVLYQLERVPHANEATLKCVDARDIETPPAIKFEMEKVPIVTAKGKEHSHHHTNQLIAVKQLVKADSAILRRAWLDTTSLLSIGNSDGEAARGWQWRNRASNR